jgi:hypothetical protein
MAVLFGEGHRTLAKRTLVPSPVMGDRLGRPGAGGPFLLTIPLKEYSIFSAFPSPIRTAGPRGELRGTSGAP